MAKATINLSPALMLLREEADSMGVSFPSLLTADVSRLRQLAAAHEPSLDAWEWECLSHVLDGIEAHRILTGIDDLPAPGMIVAEIDTWADGSSDDNEIGRAGKLRNAALAWSPLAIAAVFFRLRRPSR